MPSRHTQDATHTLGVQAGRLRTHLHALDRTLDIDVHRIAGAVVIDILDLDVVLKSYLILFWPRSGIVFLFLILRKKYT